MEKGRARINLSRTFTVAGVTNATVGAFAVPPETDLRPWRVRYSFRCRTAGFAGEGLRLAGRGYYTLEVAASYADTYEKTSTAFPQMDFDGLFATHAKLWADRGSRRRAATASSR